MKKVCIFLAGIKPESKYEEGARECAKLLAQADFDLVWGGSSHGLMNTVADVFKENGRRLIGITTERLKDKARSDADEMIVTKDIPERKTVMINNADAFVVFVGGIGTLDEIGDVLEAKKSEVINKPIVILNTNGFFDGLKAQLEVMETAGLIAKPINEIVYFADTPKDVIEYLTTYKS